MSEIILNVKGLKKYFPITKGFFDRKIGDVFAVNGIDFEVFRGETVGLVGESGCGKSTTGNCILRLFGPTAGNILYTARDGRVIDLATIPQKELRQYRNELQMVFQDPFSSLNPRMTVRDIIAEPALMFHMVTKKNVNDFVVHLLEHVGLRADHMTRYPHAFSGGQRQRIGIARAISINPRLIVCDESVSSLDVSVQAQVLELFSDLQKEFNISYLFIAHDLAAVKYISDRVVVMYVGKIVEIAKTDELYAHPHHPYTEALIAAVPSLHATGKTRKYTIEGETANPSHPPAGCAFWPRCKYAVEACKRSDQTLMPVDDEDEFGHRTACIRFKELELRGIKA